MDWFSSRDRFLKPSRTRAALLNLGAVAFAVTEFGRFVLRPLVRRHGMDDFGLTGSIGNLGGILVMIFLGCEVLNPTREQSFRLAAFYSVGFVIYEFFQHPLPKGVFDWNDVIGTGIGYLVSLPILTPVWHPWRRSRNQVGDSWGRHISLSHLHTKTPAASAAGVVVLRIKMDLWSVPIGSPGGSRKNAWYGVSMLRTGGPCG